MGRLSTRLGGFGRNERAAVALLFGVSAVPFILAAGVALDYGRALDLKTQMQSALDAGALAAAASRNLTDAQRIKLGETAFAANFKSRFGVEAVPRIMVANGTVQATATAPLPTSFMKLGGIDKMDVGVKVEIQIPQQKNAEIALALDYSDSMTEAPATGGRLKYLSMRDAAAKMVDDHPKYNDWKCVPYVPNGLVVRPLSSDHAAVKRQIQAMRPYMWTHIALGFEFGWHVLSSNAPFSEGVPGSDKDTMKVLVLLTDGKQTEQAFGAGGSETPEDGNRNLEQLCRNAKAAGIIVATVALDLDDEPTVARLRECASDPDKLFFDATTGADLAAAFDAIRSLVQEAIYIAR